MKFSWFLYFKYRMAKGHIIEVLVKYYLPAIILTFFPLSPAIGQDTIVNQYTRILSVENKDTTDIFDSVIVDSASLFASGDIAMFYQVKGLQIYPPGHPNEGKINRVVGNPNTGIYTLIRVYDVDIPGNAVIFSTYLPKMRSPLPGEVNQLITVPVFDQLDVDKTITCKAWDSARGTGGIVAIMAGSKITLNSDIDVSGKGFVGGDTTLFGGDCSKVTGSFHFENDRDSSGRKGEGAVLSDYSYKRGRQQMANAGGGGNGKFAGGGGGGNRGGGGLGGYPSEACGITDNLNNATGGFIGADLYTNLTELKNRIYFGGGGGAGNEGEGRTGTLGGNGGGIIILITDTLESQNASLLAYGESVTAVATAGAGGGGGGGVIVIDANVISGNLHMDVSGGDGGHTNYATDRSGPGGLGGAGVIWHNGSSLPGGVSTDYTEGSRGLWNGVSHGASSTGGGNDGAVLNNLIIPIRGFTFNVASGTQTICQGDTPDPIIATQPKGDLPANFQYEWLARTKSTGWAPAPGTNNQKDYAPGPLFDTTYYKRIVTPSDTMNRDTSGVVSIYVHDTISNNIIAPDDIICWDDRPDTMTGTIPVGGDRSLYYYGWENRTAAGGWTSSQEDTLAGYRYPAGLTETTYFRRKVTSGACRHYSDSLTIEVLDAIEGNQITDDQLVCQHTAADSLFGGVLTGGDNTYAYSWQLTYGFPTNWVELGTDKHFDPGVLDTATVHYYRRVVSSGGPAQDACVDASNVLTIQVDPEIFNNLLAPLDTLVCEGTDPGRIRPAQTIAGGDGMVYAYQWEESLDLGAWTPSASGNEAGYAPAPLSDTIWFRRIVHSGECRDTSSASLYNVHPMVLNNLVSDHDTVCYNTQPLPFAQDGPPVSGGTGVYTYRWKARTGQSGWADAGGANAQTGYQAGALTDTTFFARVVESGVCMDTSNILAVAVQHDIQNNIINGGLPVAEACENIGDSITGTGSLELTGGDETLFLYRWEKFNTGSQLWEDAPPDNSSITDSAYITEDMTVRSYYRRHVWSGACHDVTDSVALNVNPRPTIALQSTDHLVECYDGITPVQFNIPVQLTGTPPFEVRYNKLASDSAGSSVASGGSFTVPLYSGDITDYTITITDLIDNHICFSYTADLPSGTPTAQISRKPEPLMLLAADSVCGPFLTVTARDPISQTASGWWSSLDPGFSFEDSTSFQTELYADLDGQDKLETILTWHELNGSCAVGHRDTLVVLFEEPDPAAVLSDDSTLFFAPGAHLWALPASAGQGTWTHLSGTAQMDENDPHNPNVYVSFGDNDLDKTNENLFTWTVQNVKCPATSVDVRVERRDIALYTAFSPDGNDINDLYRLDGLEYADEFTMSIFTRQGVMIHRIEKKPGGVLTDDLWWDGRLESGDEAADGTYFYVLEVKYAGQTYQYKGYVELVRPKGWA
jgi:gliding motility-associated-like protein